MIHDKDTKHAEEIRAYDKQIIDCKVLELKGIDSINSTIYFVGVELTGGVESNLPYNECFFGELDSKNTQMGLDETKPIYYLESVNCHFENSKKYRNNLKSNGEFGLDSNITSNKHSNNQSNNNRAESKSLSNAETNPTIPNTNSKDSNLIYSNNKSNNINTESKNKDSNNADFKRIESKFSNTNTESKAKDSNNKHFKTMESSFIIPNNTKSNPTNSNANSKDSIPTDSINKYSNNTESKSTESNPTSHIHKGSSTLQAFLNNSTLTILNYSLLDSSLNIKLECTSKESKAILEQEKALRDKQESKAIQEREKAQRDKVSSLLASNDELDFQSTALLHPMLEDNEIKCPNN